MKERLTICLEMSAYKINKRKKKKKERKKETEKEQGTKNIVG